MLCQCCYGCRVVCVLMIHQVHPLNKTDYICIYIYVVLYLQYYSIGGAAFALPADLVTSLFVCDPQHPMTGVQKKKKKKKKKS